MSSSVSSSISGIEIGQEKIGIIGSNLSNTGTAAYKTAESIVYSNSYGSSNDAISSGAELYKVRTDFSQGDVKKSNNKFDMTIDSPDNFFIFGSSIESKLLEYSQTAQCKLNKDNLLVNYKNQPLKVYPLNEDGTSTSISLASLQNITIPSALGKPEQTTKIDMSFNFPISKDPNETKLISQFNPNDPKTYNYSTSSVTYDSAGTQGILKSYYIKPGLQRSIIDTKTNSLTDYSDVKVDCSIVHDPGGADDGKTAYAVFYTFNDKPIQPLNEEQTDVQGFSYRAKNLNYVIDNITVDSYKAANLDQTAPAEYLTIDNTDVNIGCIYPGKSKEQANDGLGTPSNSFPPYEPSNAKSALNVSQRYIISGDKANADRPKDFWRCAFMFIGQDSTTTKPVAKLALQPLGAAGVNATTLGTSQSDSYSHTVKILDGLSSDGKKLFRAPRGSEQPKLKIDFGYIEYAADGSAGTRQSKSFNVNLTGKTNYAEVMSAIKTEVGGATGIPPEISVDFNPSNGTFTVSQDGLNDLRKSGAGYSSFLDMKFSLDVSTGVGNYTDPLRDDVQRIATKYDCSSASVVAGGSLSGSIDQIDVIIGSGATYTHTLSSTIDLSTSNTELKNQVFQGIVDAINANNKLLKSDGNDTGGTSAGSNWLSAEFVNGNISFSNASLAPQVQIKLKKSGINVPLDGNKAVASSALNFHPLPTSGTSAFSIEGSNTMKFTLSAATDPGYQTRLTFENTTNNVSSFTETSNQQLTKTNPKTGVTSTLFPTGYVNGESDLGIKQLHVSTLQDQKINIGYSDIAVYDSDFEMTNLTSNGSSVGKFVDVDVANDGLVSANFTNGRSVNLGRVALARFNDPQGLRNLNHSAYNATGQSGQAIPGQAGSLTFGTILPSSIQDSNVDSTRELMHLNDASSMVGFCVKSMQVALDADKQVMQIKI